MKTTPPVLVVLLALLLAAPALASSSFSAELDQLCESLGRSPADPAESALFSKPMSARGDCALCHTFDPYAGGEPDAGNVSADGYAFLDGNLDPFCTLPFTNQAPEIGTLFDLTVTSGQPVLFTVEASDPDGDQVTLTAADLPTGARFDVDETGYGSFSWTPADDQAGSHVVTFIATDDGSPMGSASAEVTITVDSANRPPLLAPVGDQQATAGTVLTVVLSATDPDDDPLVFSADPVLEASTMQPGPSPESMIYEYTPPRGAVGNQVVTFQVTDGQAMDEEMIVITVGNANVPPVLEPIGDRRVDVGDALEIALIARDADLDGLVFSSEGLPEGTTLMDHENGTAVITGSLAAPGLHAVTVAVTDDGTPNEAASETFMIEAVEPPGDSEIDIAARWKNRSRKLVVVGHGAAPRAEVEVFDASSGARLGSTLANASGKFRLKVRSFLAPCSVEARTGGDTSAAFEVDGAPMDCGTPLTRVRARWKCKKEQLRVYGRRAPSYGLVRVYDADTESLLGETTASRSGRFRLRTHVGEAPDRIRVGVEAAASEWLLEPVDVRHTGCGRHHDDRDDD